jgi:hypothetical protein
VTASKQKGTKWETAVVSFMTLCGLLAKRKPPAGRFDRADLEIEGLPDWVIEAKNVARQALAEWLDELLAEMANAGARFGAVWHHRRGKGSPGDGFVTMRGDHFAALLLELKELREKAARAPEA